MTATRRVERSRLRLAIVGAVICGAVAFLVVQGLGNATTFYRNVDEAVAKRESLGTKRFRLQGVVAPDSIRDDGPDVRFVAEYHCATIPVVLEGTRPALFKEGVPVVLEGAFQAGSAKTFTADRVLIRHTEEYRTEESQRAEATDAERCDS
jgi:cytochrome c-type biogenesis protein CcmE